MFALPEWAGTNTDIWVLTSPKHLPTKTSQLDWFKPTDYKTASIPPLPSLSLHLPHLPPWTVSTRIPNLPFCPSQEVSIGIWRNLYERSKACPLEQTRQLVDYWPTISSESGLRQCVGSRLCWRPLPHVHWWLLMQLILVANSSISNQLCWFTSPTGNLIFPCKCNTVDNFKLSERLHEVINEYKDRNMKYCDGWQWTSRGEKLHERYLCSWCKLRHLRIFQQCRSKGNAIFGLPRGGRATWNWDQFLESILCSVALTGLWFASLTSWHLSHLRQSKVSRYLSGRWMVEGHWAY